MLLLQALPTSIGVAAIAPALLVLWLVIAADERPGPPARVWLAFILGAASISLLGIARAPFAAILAVPGNPWMTQGLRSIFGVAAPEEIVKVLVIIARVGAAPHVCGPDGYRGLWRGRGPRLRGLRKPRLSRAALRHVAFAGRVAQRADGAVSRRARHHRGRLYRDRARGNGAGRPPPSSRLGADFKLVPGAVRAGRVACRIRFSAADIAETSRSRPQHANAARGGQPADRIQFDRICHPAGAARRPPPCAAHRDRARAAEPVAADVGPAARGQRGRLRRRCFRADLAPSLVRQSRPQRVAASDSARPDLHSDRPGVVAGDVGGLCVRPQPHQDVLGGIFVRARARAERHPSVVDLAQKGLRTNSTRRRRTSYIGHSIGAAGIGSFQ